MIGWLLKILFRVVILFVILFFVNKYTTRFDDTKFGNFFNRFEDRLIWFLSRDESSDGIANIDDKNSSDSLTWIDSIENFSDDDIIGGWSAKQTNTASYISTSYVPRNYDIVFIDRTNQYCVTPRWQRIEDGNYIVAYKYPISAWCEFEKRYCDSNKLSGSYTYHTCLYESMAQAQSQKSLLDNDDITLLVTNNLFTYQDPEFFIPSNLLDNLNIWLSSSYSEEGNNQDYENYDMQTQIWPGIVASSYARKYATSISDNSSSSVLNNVNQTQNDPDIHFLWRWEKTVEVNDWITDLQNNALKTDTLKKILRSWWPVYDSSHTELAPSSAPIDKICTTPWWDVLSNGQYTMAFAEPSASFPTTCRSELRYCIDGVLQWTFTNRDCNYSGDVVEVTITPSLSGVDLNSYPYQYYKDTIKYTYRILDGYRWYNTSKPLNNPSSIDLSIIDINTTEELNTQNIWQSCWTEYFGIVPDGTSVVWFESMSAGSDGCVWQVRYCINWVLQWTFPYGYCE